MFFPLQYNRILVKFRFNQILEHRGSTPGLMVIKSFHEDHGENQRNVVLIPSSAHGTNPARPLQWQE